MSAAVQKVVKISTFGQNIKKEADVQDVDFRVHCDTMVKRLAVVYNPFSLESIFAAALIKVQYKDYPYITVRSVMQNIDSTAEEYVWLGVDPESIVTREMTGKGIGHRKYSNNDIVKADENGYKPNLVERVCEDLKLEPSKILRSITFMSHRFFEMGTPIEDLARIYRELKNAVAILADEEEDPQDFKDVVAEYTNAMKTMKNRFKNFYKNVGVLDDSAYVTVFYTHFADHQFILALRYIRLAHASFVNEASSMNGQLVYSNLHNPRMDMGNKKIVLLS